MKKNIWTLLVFTFLLSTQLFSQTKETPATTIKTIGIQNLKFAFDTPTDKFVLDKKGTSYQWAAGNSMVQYTAMAGKYEDMAGNLEAMYASPDMELLFNEKKKFAGTEGDLMKIRTKATENSGEEDFFFLMFLMPHEKGIIMLSASYPISQDNDLYNKILTCFDSFREVK